MRIFGTMEIRKGSLLDATGVTYDYTDTYYHTIHAPQNQVDIDAVAAAFGQSGPRWVDHLMALRDRIVALVGLKTANSIDENDGRERVGMFSVLGRRADEILLGEDDSHLNFRISITLEPLGECDKRIGVTTAVKIHNRLGRCYFFFVKPAHRIIVPRMLRHNFRHLGAGIAASK